MSRNKLSVYNETFCSPPPLVTSNMSSLVQRERDTEGFSGNRKKSKRQKKGNSDWFLYLSLYSDSKDGARTVLLLTLWTLGIYSQYKKHSAYMHVSLCNDYIIHKRIEGQKYLTDPRKVKSRKQKTWHIKAPYSAQYVQLRIPGSTKPTKIRSLGQFAVERVKVV